jgi:predicted nucleic acid-binding protein
VKAVLDASAAIEIVAERGRAKQFLDEIERSDAVIAPDLFVPEVVNAVWKHHHFEGLSVIAASQQMELAIELVDEMVPSCELFRDAFLLARNAKRPAYDMFYLALARRQDAVLLTSDTALKKEAVRLGIQVIA